MRHDDGFRAFPTTHWSLVARAGADPSDAQRDALGDLLGRYDAPFRTFLMARHQLPRDRADDLVQGFILTRLLERNLVARAAADRGKFRNLLMTALDRYAVDQFREAAAVKRQGDRGTVDVHDHRDGLADAAAADPAAAFDAAWAVAVVRQTVDRMRAATEATRPDLWGVFADRVVGPAFDGAEPTAYADLVARLGLKDPGQAASALQTAKRTFARLLRGVVAEYALTADAVDAEVADLMLALGRRG